MRRRAERRAGAAGDARARAPLAFSAWLLLACGCAVIAGCTGPGLDPPMNSTSGQSGRDGSAAGGGSPRAGTGVVGASGQGGRTGAAGGAAGARAGAGGAAGPNDDAGVPGMDAATMADAAMPDAALPDGSMGNLDAGTP